MKDHKLKRKYNRWLFKKYGFERGALFQNIPLIYRINPLFSPSLYGQAEGEQISEWFRQGVEEGMRNPLFKIKQEG